MAKEMLNSLNDRLQNAVSFLINTHGLVSWSDKFHVTNMRISFSFIAEKAEHCTDVSEERKSPLFR